MSTLISRASGNFTSASTWAVADPTSLMDADTASEATTTAFKASASFIPGAITIDGFGIFMLSRLSPASGTLTAELYNVTTATSVASVTINQADIGVLGATELGWIGFGFSSITLVAGQSYQIRVKTSVTGATTIRRDATTSNWSRYLRTTTTAAPGAGDNLIVAGNHVGTGSCTSYTVTMDNTAATIFGTISATSTAISIGCMSTLAYASAASTNYRLRVAGGVEIYGDGTLTIGTDAVPIPVTSTATLEFTITTNNDGYLKADSGGTFASEGTLTQTVTRALLNADAAATATTLTTDVATGWKAGDQIAIAPTGRTITEGELRTLSIDASGTTVTIGSGLTYAHSGSANRQAEIINLTRNVKIFGTSQTLSGFVRFKDGAIVSTKKTEYYYLGSLTANQRGINVETITDTAVIDNNSVHNTCSVGANSIGIFAYVAGVKATITNNNLWDCNYIGIYALGATGTLTIDDNWAIATGTGSSYGILINTAGTNFSRNRAAGSNAGINIVGGPNAIVMGTVDANIVHSCTAPMTISGCASSDMTNFNVWRSTGIGLVMTLCTDVWLKTINSIGHASGSISLSYNKGGGVVGLIGKGETGYTQTYSMYNAGLCSEFVVADSFLGGASAPAAAVNGDLVATGIASDITFHNTQFLSPTELYVSSWGVGNGYRSQKHQGIANNNKWARGEGTVQYDSTIYDTGGTSSSRMSPTKATYKLKSVGFTVAVLSGNTVTATARVRKSVVGDGTAYNGNAPRLMLRANPVVGIYSDVVIATSAGAAGSWETVSGTTAAVTENTALEFYIDCDGTTGWINVGGITVPTEETSLLAIYKDGTPYSTGILAVTSFTDVPESKVELAYAYKFNSTTNNRTGTRRQPTAGQVQIGVAYGPSDSLTGTYDGSDRWSDPDFMNVLDGVEYKANSLTNNKTGAYVVVTAADVKIDIAFGTWPPEVGTYDGSDRWSNPGNTNVRDGVTYKANSTIDNETGRVVLPAFAADVVLGVAFEIDGATTGTYDGSDRWADPGDSNVRAGVTYEANNVAKTGRVVMPLAATVLDGIGYNTDGATVGTLQAGSVPAGLIAQIDGIWQHLGLDPLTVGGFTNTTIWAHIIEGTYTAQESLRLQNAILAGKVSGADSGTETFRDLADTKDRVVLTTDDAGNRLTVVRDVS